jgi:serine/threonine-protein kinase
VYLSSFVLRAEVVDELVCILANFLRNYQSNDNGGDYAYVCDFGLARHISSASSLTGDRGFVGTIDYVSPEQMADAHEVDERCDIYSLGCTLYYLLRGQPPYRRDNPALILYAHCNDPIPPLGQEVPGVPESLDAVFRRMLAKKVADRISTMADVIAELEACRDSAQSSSQHVPETAEGHSGLAHQQECPEFHQQLSAAAHVQPARSAR